MRLEVVVPDDILPVLLDLSRQDFTLQNTATLEPASPLELDALNLLLSGAVEAIDCQRPDIRRARASSFVVFVGGGA